MRSYLAPCLLLFGIAAAQAEPAPSAELQPMDVFQLQWADHPQLSPDGKQVVYERCWFDVMKDRKRANLWLTDSEGRNARPLTGGAANDGGARWSPDGKRLAWVAAEDGKAQIFVRWMDSGQSAAITHLTAAPRALSWSPDGRWIAFAMRVPVDAAPLAQMPAAPKGAEWAAPAKLIDRVVYRIDGGGYVDPGYTQTAAPRARSRKASTISTASRNGRTTASR